mmetsp:Transcript_94521/g.204085  ORF Transcript_94521/g.204085 Transcript_94521/m.204085 type:complete len:198 (+) Transcript_94521:642-1235(+)
MDEGVMSIFRYWDIPGCATSNFKSQDYIKQFCLRHFDVVVLVCKDRIKEDDTMIVSHLKEMNVNYLIVRTHMGVSVNSYRYDEDIDDNVADEVVQKMAISKIKTNFNNSGFDINKVFCIDNQMEGFEWIPYVNALRGAIQMSRSLNYDIPLERQCQICYMKEINTVSKPCLHRTLCEMCASKIVQYTCLQCCQITTG